jgi:protocatechuate 3,4-dioxygenase beta subunit
MWLLLILLPATVSCQQVSEVEKLEKSLSARTTSINHVMGDPKFRHLRNEPGFRDLVRTYAPTGRAVVVPSTEPGTPVTLKGRFVDSDGSPRPGVLFYFYHTKSDGYYGKDNLAELFGYLRSDKDGLFEIQTIMPGGYPGEEFPCHVHVEVFDEKGNRIFGTEFQFAEDRRMTPSMMTESKQHRNLISKNTGSESHPVYQYTVVLPRR